MDMTTMQSVVCIALFVVLVAIVLLCWRRTTTRASIAWLGLALVPLGALLGGAVPAFIDAWNSLALWFQSAIVSPIPPLTSAGLIILGLGILLMIVSRFVPYKKKDKAALKAQKEAKKAQKNGTSTASASASTTRQRPVYQPTSTSNPTSTTTPTDRV